MDAPAGFLIDVDGVLTVSWEAVDGAVETLEGLRGRGLPLRFLTNTTSRSRAEVTRALVDTGFEVNLEEVLTAPVATAAYLRRTHDGARCLLVNEGDLSEDLRGVDIVESGPAEVVLVGGAGPTFDYRSLNMAFQSLVDGASLVAMHRNMTWRTAAGLQLDSGAFVTALERAAGVDAVVVGKPSPEFFRAGIESLGLPAERVAMIGDDLVNDVLAARAMGITGILVRTGKYRADLVEQSPDKPDFVLDSISDLLSWMSR